MPEALPQPLTCRITTRRLRRKINVVLSAMVVHGWLAAGADSATTSWNGPRTAAISRDNFHYPPIPPGGGVQGNAPVFGGLLADFDTGLLDPGLVFLRLTVFAVSGAKCVFETKFSLFKQDVRILGVDGYSAMNTSWVDPAAQFVENVPALCSRPASVSEVSFGGCLSIQGAAFVGGCEDKQIKSYTLDYKPGLETDCASPGWTSLNSPGLPMPVVFDTPVKQRYINRRTDFSTLTAVWGSDCMVSPPGPPPCFVPPWRSVPGSSKSPRS